VLSLKSVFGVQISDMTGKSLELKCRNMFSDDLIVANRQRDTN
jgi:hypothetical protein